MHWLAPCSNSHCNLDCRQYTPTLTAHRRENTVLHLIAAADSSSQLPYMSWVGLKVPLAMTTSLFIGKPLLHLTKSHIVTYDNSKGVICVSIPLDPH